MVKENKSFKLLEQYPSNAIKSHSFAVGDVVFGRATGEIRRGYLVSKVYFKTRRGSKIQVIDAASPIAIGARDSLNLVSLKGVPAFEFAKLEK